MMILAIVQLNCKSKEHNSGYRDGKAIVFRRSEENR